MRKLVVIAPSFPPSLDAVGSFAKNVAAPLSDSFSVSFLSSDKKGIEFSSSLKEADAIALHYVGYGFQKRGCPFWLVREIKEIKASRAIKLVTYFHETWAEGSPLSSVFYLSCLQRRICKEIMKLSDSVVFTSELFYSECIKLFPWSMESACILPIASTIGEPKLPPELKSRSKKAVVFGTPGRREAVFKRSGIEDLLRKLDIEEIVDIGTKSPFIPNYWGGIKVKSLGPLSNEETSKELLDSRVGLIDYPACVFSKSSIFAAYASHGLCPIVTRAERAAFDGLSPNESYLPVNGEADNADLIAKNSLSWYRTHSSLSHSNLLRELLSKKGGKDSRRRVLFVFSERTQNEAPLRYLSNSRKLNVVTAFLSGDREAKEGGKERLNKGVTYAIRESKFGSITLKNISPFPSLVKRSGLINPSLIPLIRDSEAVVAFGHFFISFWITIIASLLFRKPIFLTNDAIKGGLKRRLFLRFLYRYLADGVFVPSTSSRNYLESIGTPKEKIHLTPYSVDEEQFLETLNAAQKGKIRGLYSVGPSEKIILFCGKLIPRKRASDLLNAFSKLDESLKAVLLIVGDGPLKPELEREASSLGISGKVKFAGFIPYNELPSFYKDADTYVHPGDDEPWGLTINEAMLAKVSVVASDKIGAAKDLIEDGSSGIIFKCRDIEDLKRAISSALRNGDDIKSDASSKISKWSSRRVSEVFEEVLG